MKLDERDKIVQIHQELWLPPLKEEKKVAAAIAPAPAPVVEVGSSVDLINLKANPLTGNNTANTREKKEKKKKKKKNNNLEELNSAVMAAPKKGIQEKKRGSSCSRCYMILLKPQQCLCCKVQMVQMTQKNYLQWMMDSLSLLKGAMNLEF